ncbi:NAD/ferredoxin-dependent reductase-like protein [Mumia flava]|uniref:NAD/ferredoxin-dependent reductase-like protein n=1 Tax=Mumia flava TaxID=1348852 RepID=A0A0B2AY68_9ACTN|nr:FAD-dependent oxidoreductase [Mumia flava]PJJ56143.1 NAD/ferredoxin-dependent reductase-like protein [Mumia flava]
MRSSTSAGLLVVGGGPAGHAAARSYRESGGDGRVLVVSQDAYPPYARPPLTKEHLRGETASDELALSGPDFYTDHRIELTLRRTVTAIHRDRDRATMHGGETVDFRSCVVATGSRPVSLPVPGAHDPRVLEVRSLDDGIALRQAAESAGSAVVIGSGFIGCEAAASLCARGVTTTLITMERAPQRARLGDEVAARIAGWLDDAGVRLVTSATVRSIVEARTVCTSAGAYSGDMVLLATGVAPDNALAAAGRIACADGRVLADSRMRTSRANVLAAGDVALATNHAAGRRLAVEHWGDAVRMGEVAGANAAGVQDRWAQAPGFWSGIGDRVLKYAAWGDGYDAVLLSDHGEGAFTAWYGAGGRVVGVLTHRHDPDYERGRTLVESGADWSDVAAA